MQQGVWLIILKSLGSHKILITDELTNHMHLGVLDQIKTFWGYI